MRRFIAAVVAVVALIIVLHRDAKGELIINGNFESGNTGFVSGYHYSDYSDPSTWLASNPFFPIGDAEEYTLVDNASKAHWDAPSFGDHTSGLGTMMAINGAVVPNVVVWSETVSVNPRTDYKFSSWIASWTPVSPANLEFAINGQVIGTKFAPDVTGIWEQYLAAWNSGSSTSADIEIVDLNLDGSGNDFALDDISLRATPEPSTIILWTGLGAMGLIGAWRRRKRQPA